MTVERVEFPAPTPGKHRKGDIAVLADIANSRQISEVPASSADQDMQEGSADEDEDERELVPLHIEAKVCLLFRTRGQHHAEMADSSKVAQQSD